MVISDRSYRDKIEIIRDILEILSDERDACKTDIVYGAKINFSRLDKYISPLVENDIIDERGESRTRYFITKKGVSLLNKIHGVISII